MKKDGILKSTQKSLGNLFMEEGAFKSGQNFLRKYVDHAFVICISRIMISLAISYFIFVTGLLGLLVSKRFIFFPILGGILSFFLMGIGNFFLQNILKKKARYEDFFYVKEIVSIILIDVFGSLFFPGFLAFCLTIEISPEVKGISLIRVLYISLFLGILIFSYRIGPCITKLLKLQDKYKNKEHD